MHLFACGRTQTGLSRQGEHREMPQNFEQVHQAGKGRKTKALQQKGQIRVYGSHVHF